MKAWRLEGQGVAALHLRDEDVGAPPPGQVQIRMASTALNYRDVGIAHGLYSAGTDLIPLSDGAGTILAVGADIDGFAVGDQVLTCFYENWQDGRGTIANHRRSLGRERDGVLAEVVNLPATAIVHKPASLTAGEAATLTCAGLTAWTALFTEAAIRPGQHVVIQGTGGVAIFALQFAKMAGATATVLSSSDAKLDRAKAMGADHLVNYRATPDWAAAVLDRTNGVGADAVIELGGPATFVQSLVALKMDGTIPVVGLLAGIEATIPIPLILEKRARIHGVTVGHREDMLAMAQAIDTHGIKPVVDRAYAFEDTRQAYEDLPLGTHFGKILIDVAA